ncbi:hypothetical protein ACFLXB_08265 [Chloroflexota bacterium]
MAHPCGTTPNIQLCNDRCTPYHQLGSSSGFSFDYSRGNSLTDHGEGHTFSLANRDFHEGYWSHPVNRRENTSMVDQIAERFSENPDLIIGLAPEGTRSKVRYWRSGFYYIALKAQVPIVMAYLDYANKVVGLGPSIMPTGDIDADFEIIREFYSLENSLINKGQLNLRKSSL